MDKKKGNSCLYCLYNLFNFLFLIQSLLVIAMGAWLWYEVKKIGPFNLGLTLLGIFQFLLSLMGQHVKKSKAKMNCYLFFMGILFVAQACMTSIAIASKDKIVDWAAERGDSPEEAAHIKDLISNNVAVTLYITFGALLIQLFCIWSVYAYKKSFIERNTVHEYLIETEEGVKVPIKQHQAQQKSEITAKYDRLRKEQENKYKMSQDSAYSSYDSKQLKSSGKK